MPYCMNVEVNVVLSKYNNINFLTRQLSLITLISYVFARLPYERQPTPSL